MGNYTEQDLQLDFHRETGTDWENASFQMQISWLTERVLKFENEKQELKNLFTDGK
jgi:hypothetical protein